MSLNPLLRRTGLQRFTIILYMRKLKSSMCVDKKDMGVDLWSLQIMQILHYGELSMLQVTDSTWENIFEERYFPENITTVSEYHCRGVGWMVSLISWSVVVFFLTVLQYLRPIYFLFFSMNLMNTLPLKRHTRRNNFLRTMRKMM